MKSHLSAFSCVAYAFCVIFNKASPNPRLQKFSLSFSSKNLIILALKFRSLINFELIFIHGIRQGSASFFCMWYLVFPVPFIEETILSLFIGLGPLVKIN